jgi:hypothetical protein
MRYIPQLDSITPTNYKLKHHSMYASVADRDTDSIRLVDPDPGAKKMKIKIIEKVKNFRFRSAECSL